jgi:hypothetical protein
MVPTEGEAAITPEVNVFLPRDLLFKSLLADPRWPHFSASYQRYLGNDHLDGVGSATFGETFSFYRFGGPWNSQMEVGLQAGVFSIFDMDADSHDLVNADYFVAVPLSLKKNKFFRDGPGFSPKFPPGRRIPAERTIGRTNQPELRRG